MSQDDSLSVEEISAPQMGRLRRVNDSEEEKDELQKDQFQAEQLDSIDISEQSEVEELKSDQKLNKNKGKEKKKRQLRKKKTDEFAANSNEKKVEKQKKEKQEKQIKPKKRVVETNEKTVETLLNKKFIQADDEEEPPRREMEVEVDNARGDVFGLETKQQKQKGQKVKNINQLIKNRHKFFSEFEIDHNFEIQEENYDDLGEEQFELKFVNQKPEESALKQKPKKEMLQKVEIFKQNLHLSGKKPLQRQQSIQSSSIPTVPILAKTSSLIIEENIQQPQQQKEFKNEFIRRTQSIGLKQSLTQNDLDDPEIELFIPKINGAKDKVFDNTLFLNRIKQKGLDKVMYTSQSQNNSNKAFSRSEFEQLIRQKQVEQKASKINQQMNEFLNGFQTTTFEQIAQKNEEVKLQQTEQNGQNDDDSSSPDEDFIPKAAELNQESEDINDGSSSDSNDSKKIIDDKVKEDKISEKQIEANEEKERELDEAFIVEEKSDKMSQVDDEEKEQLEEIKYKRLQKRQSDDEDEEDNDDDDEESEGDDEEVNNEQIEEVKSYDKQIKVEKCGQDMLRPAVEFSEDEEEDQINDDDLNMFRRLKKVSTMFKERKLKEKELQEKKKQRLERQKEREKMRKFIESNLLEDQAEQGSDNESHDDVVKQINDDEEEDENEEIEKELLDMIDDKLQDLNEENEIKAFQIFMDRIHSQEKADIKKILRGEFKRKNGKVQNIDLLNMEQTEEEKQARLLHKYESSDAENYDSDFENYMKMNKAQKQEFLKEKKIQKIYQAQQEMNKQTKRNRLQEQQLFEPEILKLYQEAKKKSTISQNKPQKPLTFKQSMQQSKKTNENTNAENSNSVSVFQMQKNKQSNQQSSALNRLFSANIGQNGLQGQQLQKSPNKAVLLGKKKK